MCKIVSFLFLFVTIGLNAQKVDKSRPNIVLIIGDDISAEDIGVYGNEFIKTPNIDRLAATGMRFDNAYLTAASCSPSRASIVTGRWPHTTGAPDLSTGALPQYNLPWQDFFEGLDYFPEKLKNAGYYTAHRGKWHLGYEWNKISGPAAKGFDSSKPSDNEGGEDNWVQCIKDRPKDKPFFMWFASHDAHRGWSGNNIHDIDSIKVPPYLPNTAYIRNDLKKYYDEINRLDEYVGKVVAELKEQGILDNTIILFMADNGRPFFRSKGHIYNSGMQTPFIVHWPDKVRPNQINKNLVSAIDIAPTFMEAAGLSVEGTTIQGSSFMPLLFNLGVNIHNYVFSERNWHGYASHQRAVRDIDGFLYIRNARPYFNNLGTVDLVDYMYNEYKQGRLNEFQSNSFIAPRPSEELYKYEDDVHQKYNLLLTEQNQITQSKLKELREVMDLWQEMTGDSVPENFIPDWYDRPFADGRLTKGTKGVWGDSSGKRIKDKRIDEQIRKQW